MLRLRALLGRVFDIRTGEWRRLVLLYAFVFALNASVVWGQAAGEALFLERLGGVQDLPLMFIGDALLTVIAMIIYGAFVDRISNTRLMILIPVLGTLILVLSRVGLNLDLGFVYPLLYLLQSVLKAVISIHAWTYIADFYDTRTAKRHYPLISSGSRASGILAGFLISPIVTFFQAENLLFAWIAALLFSAYLAWTTPRRVAEEIEEQPSSQSRSSSSGGVFQNMRDGMGFITSSGLLRLMAIAAIVGTLLIYLLEYQSQAVFVEEFPSAERLASFYGTLGAVANMITLPVQMFLLSRLVAWMGVGNANLIFPGFSAISYGLLAFLPSIGSAAFARLDRTALRSAFRTPIDGLIFNAVPLVVKGRARAFINGMLVPAGTMLAGLILLAVRQEWISLAVITGLGVVIAVVYVLVSIRVRSAYARALIDMLEQEDYSFLLASSTDLTVTDATTFNWLSKKLAESESDDFTIFMARLITEVGDKKAVPILAPVARTGSASVRSMVLDILAAADLRGDQVGKLFTECASDPDAKVRRSAIAGLEQWAGSDNEQFLALALELLHDSDLDVRAQVISPLVQAGDFFYLATASQTLTQLLDDEDPQRRARGVRVLGQVGDVRFIRNLIPYLEDAEDQVRLEAAISIEALAQGDIPDRIVDLLLEHLTPLLEDPVERIRQAVIAIFGSINIPETHEVIVRFLTDASPLIRETAMDTLVRIGKPVVPVVTPALDSTNLNLRKMATLVLSRVDREEFGPLINTRVNDNLRTIYYNYSFLEAFAPYTLLSSVSILESVLEDQIEELKEEVFDLLATIHDSESVEVISESITSESAHIRANAAEALESLTTPQTARLVAPLFDPDATMAVLLDLAEDTWDIARQDIAQVIHKLITDPDDSWLRAAMTFALGEMGAASIPPAERSKAEAVEAVLEDTGQQEKRDLESAMAGLFDKLLDEPEPEKPVAKIEEPAAEPEGPERMPIDLSKEDLPLTIPEIKELLQISQADPVLDVRVAAQAAERMIAGLRVTETTQEGETVLATIERIIFLKEVSFFQGLAVDYLKVLAKICEEELFVEDAIIFNEGDSGGTMYVVVSGRVAIERRGKREGSVVRLATLDAHSYFGEMSLFDKGDRSATARAIQDTLLLKLRSAPLNALVRQHPELSLELIEVLSLRLRDMNDRIAQLTRSKPQELHSLYDKLS